jgi:multidrug efflux pump subunit AcrA (membrane-fusion protein)
VLSSRFVAEIRRGLLRRAGAGPDLLRSAPTGFAVGFLLLIGVAGLLSCKKESASVPAPPTPEVQVVTVSSQTVPDEPEFIGQIEASRLVEIRSQVTGILKQRFFTEGREVKEGDHLYQIDPVPFRAAFLSAKARVSQAGARLVQAKQNLARVKPLLKEQAVSQKDVDDAVAEELAAKAALEGAKADLVKAEFDLNNTHITAPIEGLIERTRFYEGRLITAQTDLLTIIHHVDPMYVIVSAPESFLLQRQRDIAENRVQHPGIYKLRGIMTFSRRPEIYARGATVFCICGFAHRDGVQAGTSGLSESREDPASWPIRDRSLSGSLEVRSDPCPPASGHAGPEGPGCLCSR